MTFIKKVPNSIVITANQEPQTEVAQQSQPKPQTSFGVAGSSDQFEMAPANNLDFLQQQSQSVALSQPPTTVDMTVDASSVFSFFEKSPQLDNRLPQLNDQLNSLEERKRDLTTELDKERNERTEIEKAANSVKKALASDDPIPDEVIAMVGSLGILGIIVGLPVLPVLGGLGAFLGLTSDYKSKAKQIQSELERKAAEKEAQAESVKSELESVDTKIQSVIASIEKEKLRLEREAQPARERMGSGAIVQEPVWQEFRPDQNLIQNENISFPFNVDPNAPKEGW